VRRREHHLHHGLPDRLPNIGGRHSSLNRNRRTASGLSPFIRHGLITLRRAWDHVAGGPGKDVEKFRDELMWEEYARHWYLRHGRTPAGTLTSVPISPFARRVTIDP